MHKEEMAGAAKAALAGEDKKPKKKHVGGIHLRKGHKGGFISKHDMHDDNGPTAEQHEYPLADLKALHAHIDEHLGERDAASEQATESGNDE